MKCKITLKDKTVTINLNNPLDISMPLSNKKDNPSAWYVSAPTIEPVKGEVFIGSVAKGGSVNFRNISFNPHGNGTHTECVGHISKKVYSINNTLKKFHFHALLISIEPKTIEKTSGTRKIGDKIITLSQIKTAISDHKPQAIIIRTTPNTDDKLSFQYSNTNPAYLAWEAAKYISELGIDHLLLDLPSVDKENDNGELLAHKAFWNYPNNIQFNKTITELIYVDNKIKDGEYLLNLQIASFENDASPSKPVIYNVN